MSCPCPREDRPQHPYHHTIPHHPRVLLSAFRSSGPWGGTGSCWECWGLTRCQLSALIIGSPLGPPGRGRCYCSHFTDEETESQS